MFVTVIALEYALLHGDTAHIQTRACPVYIYTENSWPTVLKFVKKSFLHISIKHKTIMFLLHTTTVRGLIVTVFVSL